MTSRRSLLKILGAAIAAPAVAKLLPFCGDPPREHPPLREAQAQGRPSAVLVRITAATASPDVYRGTLVGIGTGRGGIYRGVLNSGDLADMGECHIFDSRGASRGGLLPSSIMLGQRMGASAVDGKPVMVV